MAEHATLNRQVQGSTPWLPTPPFPSLLCSPYLYMGHGRDKSRHYMKVVVVDCADVINHGTTCLGFINQIYHYVLPSKDGDSLSCTTCIYVA